MYVRIAPILYTDRMGRTTIEISEETEQWVDETFGDIAVSKSEAIRMALWYARHCHDCIESNS